MQKRRVLFTILWILVSVIGGRAWAQSQFTNLGQVVAPGLPTDMLVGPGPNAAERLYVDYTYNASALEVVSIDPTSGAFTVYKSPLSSESSPKGMVVGNDGNIYLGTAPNAHLFQLNPNSGELLDLGKPSASEQYIWSTALGSDGCIYGSTYPAAKLVRYNPTTKVLEDLGRMDPTEMYARYVAADSNGFVYVGIGYGTAHLVAYQISSQKHQDILPPAFQTTGAAQVFPGATGEVYALMNNQYFLLNGWTAIPISASSVHLKDRTALAAGGEAWVSGGSVTVTTFGKKISTKTLPYGYAGEALPLFSVGIGPDGKVYGSTAMPFDLFVFDPQAGQISNLGKLGGGEAYSFLTSPRLLLMGAYSANAPLLSYDATQPFSVSSRKPNPTLTTFNGADSTWRPGSMTADPNGQVYIGSLPGYGCLGAPLTVWSTKHNRVARYDLYPDQSVQSVAWVSNLVVGGTSIYGGGGSIPTASQAKLFIWDPSTTTLLYDIAVVSDAPSIDNVAATSKGIIFGTAGKVLFTFDPVARNVLSRSPLSFTPIAHALVEGPDGALWGLAAEGIYTVDPQTGAATLVAASPSTITGGMGMDANYIYYTSGTNLYRFQWR